MDAQLFSYYGKEYLMDKDQLLQDNPWHPSMKCGTIETSQVPSLERKVKEKRVSQKTNREMSRREDGLVCDVSKETYGTEVPVKHKVLVFSASSEVGVQARTFSLVKKHSLISNDYVCCFKSRCGVKMLIHLVKRLERAKSDNTPVCMVMEMLLQQVQFMRIKVVTAN